MANQLFNMLGGNRMPQMPGPIGGMMNMISQLNQFKQTFRGNPQQQVQQMLNSGQITQDQFNQVAQMATQIQGMLTGNAGMKGR